MPVRILIVDDEPMILKGLRFSLEQDGYLVEEAADGETALFMAQSCQYDIILLDVMLPKLSGIEVLQGIRDTMDVPVIMLTAKGDDMEKILGLEYGADDYMVKPFNILEVKARIRTVLRRTMRQTDNRILIGDLEMDLLSRSITRSGKSISLTRREFDLMRLFMENPGRIFDRQELMESLKSEEQDPGSAGKRDLRTADVYISRLRLKVERDPERPEYIVTRWGLGYCFVEK